MSEVLTKYAKLLVHYCMEIKPGDRLYVSSSILAEPLIREVYRTALQAGAAVDVDMDFREKNRILLNEGSSFALEHVSPLYQKAMAEYEAYLYIKAPFNLREEQNVNRDNARKFSDTTLPMRQDYFRRSATRELKRNFCLFPPLPAHRRRACRWKNTSTLFMAPAAFTTMTRWEAGWPCAAASNR